MADRLGKIALVVALLAAVGWPALATVLTALAPPTGAPAGGGLIGGPDEASAVPRPLGLAFTTVKLVLMTEALALPLALPLALLLFRTDVWGRRPLLGLVALSAFVPLPLHATAWLGAFGNLGRARAFGAFVLTGLPGAAMVHALAALPWLVLLAGVGLRTVEPELEEAALLDLPAWRVLVQVTLRRGLGALAGATLAVAVLTAGDMTVTDLLSVRTYAEEAYVQFQVGRGPATAAAVVLPPLLVLGGLVVWAARGLLRADPARLAAAASRGRVWRLGPWRVPIGLWALVAVGNLLALPLYSLIWQAGRVGGLAARGQRPHWSLFGLLGTLLRSGAETIPLLGRSALWAGLGASATVALAWGLAWVSRRPGVWRGVTAATVALTLAAPGPVAGMALVLGYRAVPFLYNGTMLVLAAMMRTVPYALLVLWPAVRTLPQEYLDAAALDGDGTWGQVRRVALPLTRGAIVAAWGVSFVLALGELPATILVAPPGSNLLAVVIWGLLHTGIESHLAGVVLVTLAVVAVAGGLAVMAFSLYRLGFENSCKGNETGD